MKGIRNVSFAHPVRDGFRLGVGFMLAAISLEALVLGVWYGIEAIGPVALAGAGLILFIVACFVLAGGKDTEPAPPVDEPAVD